MSQASPSPAGEYDAVAPTTPRPQAIRGVRQSVAIKSHPTIEAFRQARQKVVDDAAAPARAAQAAKLAALRQRLIEHAGADVVAAMTVDPHPMHVDHLRATAPRHIPVRVRDENGKLKFDVRRGIGTQTFDHLGDALNFGAPIGTGGAEVQGPVPATFNTIPPAAGGASSETASGPAA